MKKLPKESIDLIVTSPPYNVGIEYEKWNDKLPVEEYFNFVKRFLRMFKKVLKKDGRFAINIGYEVNMKHTGRTTRISLLGEYYNLIKKIGLNYNATVDLKEKTPHRTKYSAWGSWLNASSPYIYNPKECILIGYKEQWKKEKRGESTMNNKLFKEIVSGIWDYEVDRKRLTVANFSEDIPYKAINGLSYKEDIVLDPFMGSGTTADVAEKLGRKWIGIEISEKYCEINKQRIEEIK
jgi:site-specific DNA-methyltransferase (adenine-specific)